MYMNSFLFTEAKLPGGHGAHVKLPGKLMHCTSGFVEQTGDGELHSLISIVQPGLDPSFVQPYKRKDI